MWSEWLQKKQCVFCWFAVKALKLPLFSPMLLCVPIVWKSGLFYPEDFGVIVESGEGEPSAEVRQKMESEYGFNHAGMVDIPDAGNAQSIARDFVRVAINENN
jgi:hypothetical protein